MNLKEYLAETGESPSGFARRAGIDPGSIKGLLRGTQWVYWKTAERIERASGGKVKIEDCIVPVK